MGRPPAHGTMGWRCDENDEEIRSDGLKCVFDPDVQLLGEGHDEGPTRCGATARSQRAATRLKRPALSLVPQCTAVLVLALVPGAWQCDVTPL